MKRKYKVAFLLGLTVLLPALFSCTVDNKRNSQAQNIVINEVMTRNRTGLLNEKHKPTDWIELKNTSSDSINLKDFRLAVVPDENAIRASKSKKGKKINDSDLQPEVWDFPDVTVPAGKCILIFADNGKTSDFDNTLSADFKLPKEGGTIQFQTPNGQVLKELKYGKLSPDQSLARQSDNSYEPTFWQSPGFDNDRQGYEKAMEMMDDQRKSPLLIWEVMSREKTSASNWVELKNVSDKEIDLSQYALSKKSGKNEEKWQLPARKLQPGQFITIQLAGNDRNPNNPLQAPFKTGDSETVVLTKDGKFVDGVCAKMTTIGGSIGRANGRKGFFYYSTPTRNAENGSEPRRFIAALPEFNIKPGIYPKQDKLVVKLKKKDTKVHYTLNGSAPTAASPLLTDSIVITKNTTIRTFAEGDSTSLKSNIATNTFILDADHDIPVINITVNRGDLYDFNTGIYADGPDYGEEWPHLGANFWKPWTKNAHVELFDGNTGFSTDCGLKIFGGYSRNDPKKSFRLKFRGYYGDSELDYDFFDNGQPLGLRDLVLRSGSQDWNRCMVRDEFFTSLMKAQSPTLLVQEYRPVALYINGEYFGLYFMREKIDKHFVARKLNIPNDNINIIMSRGYNEEGSKTAYFDMLKYVQTHDMTRPENYNYIKNLVDLQGLIDYKIGEIYSGNTDVGNIRYVRSTDPKSDKKWHFVFYDLDATWVGYKPSANFYLGMTGEPAEANVTHHNILINKLLPNPEFRQLFLQRLSHHLSTTFDPKNATTVFNGIVEKIRPEMKLNCQRWPQLSYNTWEKNVADFQKKFADKPKVMLNDLRKYLNITEEENKKYFSKLGY